MLLLFLFLMGFSQLAGTLLSLSLLEIIRLTKCHGNLCSQNTRFEMGIVIGKEITGMSDGVDKIELGLFQQIVYGVMLRYKGVI